MAKDLYSQASGFYIRFAGEPSVGIFPAEWEIKGDFYFDSQKSFDEFKDKLADLWANDVVDDVVGVSSFEEWEEYLKKEEQEFGSGQ